MFNLSFSGILMDYDYILTPFKHPPCSHESPMRAHLGCIDLRGQLGSQQSQVQTFGAHGSSAEAAARPGPGFKRCVFRAGSILLRALDTRTLSRHIDFIDIHEVFFQVSLKCDETNDNMEVSSKSLYRF